MDSRKGAKIINVVITAATMAAAIGSSCSKRPDLSHADVPEACENK